MTLAACIVDNRVSNEWLQCIEDFSKKLPADTNMFIYHGRQGRFVKHIFPDSTRVEMPEPFGMYQYNKLLTSPDFWEKFVEYDRVLIFQTDAAILREGIEEFLELEYGYYGAPFWFQPWPGNGGLSLRDPVLMLEVCNKYKWDEQMNEDIFFSNILHAKYPNKLAPREICDRFSVESVFKLGTWGTHSPQKWLSTKECEQIFSQYQK